MEQIQ